MIARRMIAIGTLLAALTGCTFRGLSSLPLPGSPPVGDHSYVVTAEFANALTLTPDETVRYQGVVIGRVDSVARDGWNARVGLRLNADHPIPANVSAHIGQSSLLGEKFVALDPPAQPQGQLAGGDSIGLAHTSSGREVEQVLGSLSLLLNGGGLSQIRTITAELRRALGDDGAARTFMSQLDQFVTTLDRSRGQIIDTMAHLNALSTVVNGESADVTTAIDRLTRAATVLAQQRGSIVAMLGHLDRFSMVATSVVRGSGDAVVADLAALRPVLTKLASTGNDLPKAIEPILSFPFPDVVLTAIVGDFVNLDVLVDLSPLIIAGQSAGQRGLLSDPVGGLLNGLLPGSPTGSPLPTLPGSPLSPGGLSSLLPGLGTLLGGGR